MCRNIERGVFCASLNGAHFLFEGVIMKKTLIVSTILFIILIFSSCAFHNQGESEEVKHPYLKFYELESECYVTDCDETVVSAEIPSHYNNKPVTRIDLCAFSGCTALSSVKIPDTVTFIDELAFYNCVSLRGIRIPNSVTTIGPSAFSNCSWLETITLSDNITQISNNTFFQCKSLRNIFIPDKVTLIGEGAFFHCSNLENVYCSPNLEEIGALAFSECENLTGIDLEETKLRKIRSMAFYKCSNLTGVIIPKSVSIIEESAFSQCENLFIFCEVYSKPTGWDDEWCFDVYKVSWKKN